MAKKIRLDFSKVEERSGWNTRGIPEGLHKMKIEAVQITEAGDGTPMWVYALVPTDSRFKSRRFPFYCKLQQNQLWKLRDLFVAAGLTVPKKAVSLDPEAPVGKLVAGEVEDETGQYAGRSSVNAVYGLDILDEDEGAPADDEDDEEYDEDEAEEEDEDEVDEDEEDEEDDEEEEEDELLTLTLAELRKRAKGLGIDTNGLKKDDLIEAIREEEEDEEADDEDDLDDEDLDDEDLDEEEFEDDEDEEEEPAPAPRRKAPARKAAPAKAAPKRTVKRR